MAKTLDEVRDDAMTLTIEERSWLADSLWSSLRTAEEQEIDEAWLVEIERRVAEVEAGTAKLIPAEDVIRELKLKYARRRSG